MQELASINVLLVIAVQNAYEVMFIMEIVVQRAHLNACLNVNKIVIIALQDVNILI